MLLVGLSILLDSSLGFLWARLVLGSPLGTVLPALVLIIGADVCLQIANSRISLTIAKILDVQSENHFLVRRQKMIKHMQNNGQAADLQKTPRIEILKWLGEQKSWMIYQLVSYVVRNKMVSKTIGRKKKEKEVNEKKCEMTAKVPWATKSYRRKTFCPYKVSSALRDMFQETKSVILSR